MNLQEYLKPFIDRTQVNDDGVYLKGLTREEAIQQLQGTTVKPDAFSSVVSRSREICEKTIDARIREWQDHTGDKLLYVLTNRGANELEIVKMWASDLTEDKWEVSPQRGENDAFPRLLRKV